MFVEREDPPLSCREPAGNSDMRTSSAPPAPPRRILQRAYELWSRRTASGRPWGFSLISMRMQGGCARTPHTASERLRTTASNSLYCLPIWRTHSCVRPTTVAPVFQLWRFGIQRVVKRARDYGASAYGAYKMWSMYWYTSLHRWIWSSAVWSQNLLFSAITCTLQYGLRSASTELSRVSKTK